MPIHNITKEVEVMYIFKIVLGAQRFSWSKQKIHECKNVTMKQLLKIKEFMSNFKIETMSCLNFDFWFFVSTTIVQTYILQIDFLRYIASKQ